MRVALSIKGDKALRANLRRMALIKKSEVNAIMEDALEPMRELTSENALKLRQPGRRPRGGHLDEGVVAVPRPEQSSASRTTWWVTFARRARKIAHLVEFGTAPHAQPNRGIFHPGARPKPFFRPAFEMTKSETFNKLSRGIQTVLLGRIK